MGWRIAGTETQTTRSRVGPTTRAWPPRLVTPGVTTTPRRQASPARPGFRIDGLALAALLLIAFILGQSLLDRVVTDVVAVETNPIGQLEQQRVSGPLSAPLDAPAKEAAPAPPDPYAITYPYETYWLTQGVHGASYGHAAIDLAAGKGATVKSPISGQVAANYVDGYGNTTLVIENDVFRVTMLHGDYSVVAGQAVALGQAVGSEGNNGYTMDMQGRSCRDRDCGYHTHLNIFDKERQMNVNPLDALR